MALVHILGSELALVPQLVDAERGKIQLVRTHVRICCL